MKPPFSDQFASTHSTSPKSWDWGFSRPFAFGFFVTCLILLSGCSIATLPVRATSKVVDWSTTSRDEADRNRGRAMRKREEDYEQCRRAGYPYC